MSVSVSVCVSVFHGRAGGTGQAGQAKTGPLFLHVMFGIDRYTVMVVGTQSIFAMALSK